MNLTLTLKRQYFDEISRGEKTVEYRRLSPYYERLFKDPTKWKSVTFHYYRREKLTCRVLEIRKIKRPAKFSASEYLNTPFVWGIFLDDPIIVTKGRLEYVRLMENLSILQRML